MENDINLKPIIPGTRNSTAFSFRKSIVDRLHRKNNDSKDFSFFYISEIPYKNYLYKVKETKSISEVPSMIKARKSMMNFQEKYDAIKNRKNSNYDLYYKSQREKIISMRTNNFQHKFENNSLNEEKLNFFIRKLSNSKESTWRYKKWKSPFLSSLYKERHRESFHQTNFDNYETKINKIWRRLMNENNWQCFYIQFKGMDGINVDAFELRYSFLRILKERYPFIYLQILKFLPCFRISENLYIGFPQFKIFYAVFINSESKEGDMYRLDLMVRIKNEAQESLKIFINENSPNKFVLQKLNQFFFGKRQYSERELVVDYFYDLINSLDSG